MKRYFFIIIPLTLLSSTTQAKTMYVVDYFKIMVRRQPGEEYKIVAQLPSNTKVTLLETEELWAKISFEKNKTGWILKRYLTEEIPKPVRIAELEKTIKDKEEKIDALEKENIFLKQKNAEMGESIAVQAEQVKNVSLENQRLKEEPYRIILLLSGGGIFLIGCIATLIIQRLGREKKSKLSF